ncbi:hypothetical protein G3I56_09600 [Streptomyces sp. SID12488]|nr:hypothetical protein [Streptomyces sp. SID12488]
MPTSKPSTPTATLTDTRIDAPADSDLTPLLTAWDQAHSAAVSTSVPAVGVVDLGPDPDPDWRHLLDEIAHPRTTQAFHRLAEAAA